MKLVAENKRARFEYELLETFEAGIELTGDEIKSVRAGHISLADSYGFIKDEEVFLRNTYIKEYDNSFMQSANDTKRDRKLLLHKLEIKKLIKFVAIDKLTLVPTKAYFVDNKLKIELAVARGKKLFDKRETIKKREIERKARAQE